MVSGRRITVLVSVALVAAAASFVPSRPARAQSCNPGDLLNAVVNSISSLATCGSGVDSDAAIALTAVLAGVAAVDGQSAVDSFCTSVNNANNGADDVNTLLSYLPGLSSELQQELQSAVAGIADPLALAQCSCQTEQNLDQVGSDFGNCLEAFLCAGDALFGTPCQQCNPSPPVLANCSAALTNCATTSQANSQGQLPASDQSLCTGGLGNTPVFLAGENGQQLSNYTPVTEIQGPNGTLVLGGTGDCGPSYYCVCPPNMVAAWVPDLPENSWAGVPFGTQGWYVFTCQCPPGSHSTSDATADLSSCICDNSNRHPVAPVKSEANPGAVYCPLPLTGKPCPAGQVNYLGNCVTPCSNAGDVMTPDGICCNPSQVTSCGTCCPAGDMPDPANGTCKPETIAQ
jgi:hypothetical protein